MRAVSLPIRPDAHLLAPAQVTKKTNALTLQVLGNAKGVVATVVSGTRRPPHAHPGPASADRAAPSARRSIGR